MQVIKCKNEICPMRYSCLRADVQGKNFKYFKTKEKKYKCNFFIDINNGNFRDSN